MNFQKNIFLNKWNKSLTNSKTVFISRSNVSETTMTIAFKNLKSVAYSRYMLKIGKWCDDNDIESSFIDILPNEDDEDQVIFQGIHIQFKF